MVNIAQKARSFFFPSWKVMSFSSWGIALLSAWAISLFMKGKQQADDFASLWLAGELVNRGQSSHIYDYDTEDFSAWSGDAWGEVVPLVKDIAPFPHPFVHIPLMADLFAFLARHMSPADGLQLLTFCSVVAAFIIAASCYSLWSKTPSPVGIVSGVAMLLIISAPFTLSLWIGQTTPIILAGVLYAMAKAEKGPVSAGIILGIVAAIKLTPIAVIAVLFLFSRTRWTSVIAACTAVCMFGVSVIKYGKDFTFEWVHRVQEISQLVLVSEVNQSFVSLYMRDKVEGDAIVKVISPDAVPTHFNMYLLVATASFALLALVASFLHTINRIAVLTTSALIVTMAFTSLAWTHYYIVAFVVIVGLWFFTTPVISEVGKVFSAVGTLFIISPTAGLTGTNSSNDMFFLDGAALYATVGMTAVLIILTIIEGTILRVISYREEKKETIEHDEDLVKEDVEV